MYESSVIDILIDYIKNDKTKEIKDLIESGVDVNMSNKNGNTALMYAAAFNKDILIKILIKAGAKLDTQNNYDKTALIYASKSYNSEYIHIEIIKLLIDAGADWNIKDEDDRDFLYYLDKKKDFIIDLYPEQYKNYLIKKDSGKYNL